MDWCKRITFAAHEPYLITAHRHGNLAQQTTGSEILVEVRTRNAEEKIEAELTRRLQTNRR